MKSSKIAIEIASYDNETHRNALFFVLNDYAMDEMGLNKPLASGAKDDIIDGMNRNGNFFSLMASIDEDVVGIANCVESFSTFSGKPVINVHDLAVLRSHRGKGIGKKLLDAIQQEAKKRDASKITMEVRIDNRARNLYSREGFGNNEPPMSFWIKKF